MAFFVKQLLDFFQVSAIAYDVATMFHAIFFTTEFLEEIFILFNRNRSMIWR